MLLCILGLTLLNIKVVYIMIVVTVLLQIGFVEDKNVINESNETVNIEIYKNGLTSLSLNASLQIYYNTTGKQ